MLPAADWSRSKPPLRVPLAAIPVFPIRSRNGAFISPLMVSFPVAETRLNRPVPVTGPVRIMSPTAVKLTRDPVLADSSVRASDSDIDRNTEGASMENGGGDGHGAGTTHDAQTRRGDSDATTSCNVAGRRL